jgi:acetyl-CoA carboxylase carboxyl transferase subunit alpha
MMENTWYSVISPESCSSILWRSWDHKEQAAEALRLTSHDNLELGLIDGIIPEPLGGAHKDPQAAYQAVKDRILRDLETLGAFDADTLIEARIRKFSSMGVFSDAASESEPAPEQMVEASPS